MSTTVQSFEKNKRPTRLIIALLLSFVCIAPANAEDVVFYQKETDKFWSVFGEADTETGQVTCYGRANKKDGSFIQIHRSLVNGEVWAIIRAAKLKERASYWREKLGANIV